jgi:hypothetical protein
MKRYAKHAAYAAIALVFLWTVAWMYVAQRIVRQADAWRAEQAQAGVALDWDTFDVKGWPFAWRATAVNPRASRGGPAPWNWSGERLVAAFEPWNPAEIRLRLPGAQRVAFGATALVLRAARPDAKLILDALAQPARLDLDLEALEAARDGGKPIQIRKLDLSLAILHGDTRDAKLLAQGIRLAEPVPGLAAFGTDVARVELAGQLRGAAAGAASFGAAIRAWRDAGGTLEANTLALEWGPLRIAGDGTLALDDRDRPLGAGTLRIAGWNEAIDALQAARALEPAPAAILKGALNFMSRMPGGEPGTVRVPLAAQDGRLVVHLIPVAILPSLKLD